MALRGRLRRLQQEAEKGAVVVRQKDGSVRTFGVMEVQKEMFLAQMDLLRDTARDSDVLDAVRNATLQSRTSFEERFGAITFSEYIIAAEYSGGWVEVITLTEDGRVQRVRYEGGTSEADRIRREARGAAPQ